MGEKIWNRDLQNEESGKLGNANTEAYAHLVLMNNWKAWMLSCRHELGPTFTTMYASDTKPEDKTLLDIILPDTEFAKGQLEETYDFSVSHFVLLRILALQPSSRRQ